MSHVSFQLYMAAPESVGLDPGGNLTHNHQLFSFPGSLFLLPLGVVVICYFLVTAVI